MSKKNYEKPEIKQVAIIPEEAVLSGCKRDAGDGTGKNNKGCNASACRKGVYGS